MPPVNVQSIKAIERFQLNLKRFRDRARGALEEIEGELSDTKAWLAFDRQSYWKQQTRRRHQELADARNALLGAKMSTLKTNRGDEQRAVRLAEKRLIEAQEKSKAVRFWSSCVDSETQDSMRICRQLGTTVEHDVQHAIHRLEALINELQEYAELRPPAPRKPSNGAVDS